MPPERPPAQGPAEAGEQKECPADALLPEIGPGGAVPIPVFPKDIHQIPAGMVGDHADQGQAPDVIGKRPAGAGVFVKFHSFTVLSVQKIWRFLCDALQVEIPPRFLFFWAQKKRKRAVHSPKEKKTPVSNGPGRLGHHTGVVLRAVRCKALPCGSTRRNPFLAKPFSREAGACCFYSGYRMASAALSAGAGLV